MLPHIRYRLQQEEPTQEVPTRPFASLAALLALATIGILVAIAVHYLWPLG